MSDSDLLSDEWLADLPGRALGDESVAGTFQYLVTGAPGGKVPYWVRVEAGKVVESGAGKAPSDADVSFEVSYKVATALDAGDVPLDIAYMRGDLKADGNNKTLLTLLAAAHA